MTATLALLDWSSLGDDERRALLRRPAQREMEVLRARAAQIVGDVRARGDAALRDYTASFDGVQLDSLAVTAAEFEEAAN